MGQTQILLIVLSVIIVGVAVAVGIDQFAENALTSNRDAVAGDCRKQRGTPGVLPTAKRHPDDQRGAGTNEPSP